MDFPTDFEIAITHCAGKENIADALPPLPDIDGSVASLKLEETPEFQDNLGKGYLSDRKMKPIIDISDHDSPIFIKEKYFLG